MGLEMVVNELATSAPAADVYKARECMSRFILTIRRAVTLGASRVLRTSEDFSETLIAPEYSISHWSRDDENDRDARRYLWSLSTKAPYTDGLPDLAGLLLTNEYQFNGAVAHGLGVACSIDGMAVSIDSTGAWNFSRVPLIRECLSDEPGSEIESSEEFVVHASSLRHVNEHEVWIRGKVGSSVSDGIDLWHRRIELFPALQFCARLQGELSALGKSNVMLQPTIKRLNDLNTYCRNWTEGEFNPDEVPGKVTPESATRLRQYGQELMFVCPDGKTQLFSWHARMTPGPWRLHFWPDRRTRTIVVGRVGR